MSFIRVFFVRSADTHCMWRNASAPQCNCLLQCVTPRFFYCTDSETVSRNRTKKGRTQGLKGWTRSQMEECMSPQTLLWLYSPHHTSSPNSTLPDPSSRGTSKLWVYLSLQLLSLTNWHRWSPLTNSQHSDSRYFLYFWQYLYICSDEHFLHPDFQPLIDWT